MEYDFDSMINRIKTIKKKRNITNAKLSEMSGVPYGTLNKILGSETKEPSVNAIIKISKALNVSTDYIINGNEESNHISQSHLLPIEKNMIKKYRTLDEHGKKMVDFTLNEEYERCTVVVQEQPETKYINLKIAQLPASAGTGVELSDENYEIIPVKCSELTEQADFAVTVSGDSMQPTYYDGDILLVENIPAQIGDIGVFVVDGDGYVKEYGGDRLISHNEEYPDIMLKDHDYVMCSGKVIGVLEDSDIE